MTAVVGAAIIAVAIVTAVRPRAAVVAAIAMTSEWLASALTIILMNENQGRREMIDQPVCFVGSIDII